MNLLIVFVSYSFMEVDEIQKDKVAAISDQCLANYMLYYEFFSQKSIPFSEVLAVGFVHFREGVIQSVNTLLNLFAKENLYAYIKEAVLRLGISLSRKRKCVL